jgi:uncharacterized protein YfaS (alpha-2-macroglobulin family)
MTQLLHKSFRGNVFAVCALCLLMAFSGLARAQEEGGEDGGGEYGYKPAQGVPFFVLTDTQYGSNDEVLLRVEIPVRNGGMEAVRQYGGVDVLLYRIPQPLAFLKAQKNLHRVEVTTRLHDEGVANTLSYLWSNAWNESRHAWRNIFSRPARRSVTKNVQELSTHYAKPEYRPETNFKPLEGYPVVDRFRYPLMAAKPIEPPQNVALDGSSSNFLGKNTGNFYVPLGKQEPGLYLAEAIIGTHRAVTLVFVSDTIAITKIASGALTVWTAHRVNGEAVANTKLQWTDGRGVLASATTDAMGLATLKHTSPERTYLLGMDAQGGVFVSENFYYDSEIYDTKLYAITDRPLYRPGDLVGIKLMAREYRAANESVPAKAATVDIHVYDPNGTPVLTTKTRLSSDKGADTAFRLPEEAIAGGYEIRVAYENKQYSAAFRVAEYVKPHFEISLLPDRESFKTGEPVSGVIKLSYPDGKPVRNADVELTLRAQILTMVQGELRYGGLFPIQLSTASLTTDQNGTAKFSLPPTKEPSRLILSISATDGAAYRVRNTRELLVERAAVNWRLIGERKFSTPGQTLHLRLEPENENASTPTQWEIIRLEDQTKQSGAFDATAREWRLKLEQSGSYSLLLRNAQGELVAATSHWVSGAEVKAIPGTIEMVADKERYLPGETAQVLITFSEPVEEALLTLERDRVDASRLLSAAGNRSGNWAKTERLAPNQWLAHVPITNAYAPNITFSTVYVKNGEYVFQNAGLVVETEKVALEITSKQKTVQPGDEVTVEVSATLKGKPVQAMLTVSVVDEMIYALQPEIAPDIVEFFQHVRRNNVRTGASLNFITYDEASNHALDAAQHPPARHQYNERGIKVLERARRDDVDTALWLPTLLTNAQGKARFRFRMPDALSRWRITVRAVAMEKPGSTRSAYGQRISFLQSHKPLYAKWTAPDWLRTGDTPIAQVTVFNNSEKARQADVALKVAGQDISQSILLPRGVTHLPFKLPKLSGAILARIEVREAGKTVDALEVPLSVKALRWRGPREQILSLTGDAPLSLTPEQLPANASDLRLRFVSGGSEHFLRIADSLIDYPWGCVEQTSSRLIPLAIVTPLLSPGKSTQGRTGQLWQTLYSQRLRLASLAGPKAVFGWWGDRSGDSAFISAYAYYADWYAVQALDIHLPAEHWEHVLEIYRDHAQNEPLLHRALSLWFIQQIGLPVRTQTEGLLAELAALPSPSAPFRQKGVTVPESRSRSPILADPEAPLGLAYTRVLAGVIAKEARLSTAPDPAYQNALLLLRASRHPSARALLLLAGEEPPSAASEILAATSEETPTIDRALTLVWTKQAFDGRFKPGQNTVKPSGDWQAATPGRFGEVQWRWPDKQALPKSLELENKPPVPVTAILRYEANEEAGKSTLPVTIERQLYRLQRRSFEDGQSAYAAIPVGPGEKLSTQELYLDEIRLASNNIYYHGLVEAPLPPGAAIEHSTWGIELLDDVDQAGGSNVEKPSSSFIERSRAEEHRDRYGVPVDKLGLGEDVVLRHLLRVSQTGHFVLPPVRYYRMYQPERKAFSDGGGNTAWRVD